jgi:LPS export ABC transporter protein LptC
MKKTKLKVVAPLPEPLELMEENASSKRTGRNVRLLIASLVVIGVLIWLLNKSKSGQTQWESTSLDAKSPDAVIEKFHLISSVQGEKHWELFSNRALLYQGQKKALADNIFAQYFKKNRIVSTLNADKAIINTETNETQVEEHVELITENGSKLETDKLTWNQDTDEIKTDSRVHVYKGKDDITAVGMVADTQLNNVQFKRDVTTRVRDTRDVEDFNKPKKF